MLELPIKRPEMSGDDHLGGRERRAFFANSELSRLVRAPAKELARGAERAGVLVARGAYISHNHDNGAARL